jgi:hypothetical protein
MLHAMTAMIQCPFWCAERLLLVRNVLLLACTPESSVWCLWTAGQAARFPVGSRSSRSHGFCGSRWLQKTAQTGPARRPKKFVRSSSTCATCAKPQGTCRLTSQVLQNPKAQVFIISAPTATSKFIQDHEHLLLCSRICMISNPQRRRTSWHLCAVIAAHMSQACFARRSQSADGLACTVVMVGYHPSLTPQLLP